MKALPRLSAIVSDIDKLEHQRSSGTNSNFMPRSLFRSEIENFLTYNCIVFDQFSEFKNLTDFFLRGLFASYASNQRISGQIEIFPDWLLETY